MPIAEEIPHLNDCFLVNLDVEDSPFVEVPLSDVYDIVTSTLVENYRDTIHEAITQILEDTMLVNASMMETFLTANFSIFDIRDGGIAVSLRTASQQRLVSQAIATRPMLILDVIQIQLLIDSSCLI